jgi:Na+-driven multidrug efflux pump
MKDLTQGSVTKHLLQMTGFLAISMVVQTLYLLADLYWVGHLGKEAIAAVGVAGNFTMVVLALTQMLGVGTTTLISQATGRKGSTPSGSRLQPIFRDVGDRRRGAGSL